MDLKSVIPLGGPPGPPGALGGPPGGPLGGGPNYYINHVTKTIHKLKHIKVITSWWAS